MKHNDILFGAGVAIAGVAVLWWWLSRPKTAYATVSVSAGTPSGTVTRTASGPGAVAGAISTSAVPSATGTRGSVQSSPTGGTPAAATTPTTPAAVIGTAAGGVGGGAAAAAASGGGRGGGGSAATGSTPVTVVVTTPAVAAGGAAAAAAAAGGGAAVSVSLSSAQVQSIVSSTGLSPQDIDLAFQQFVRSMPPPPQSVITAAMGGTPPYPPFAPPGRGPLGFGPPGLLGVGPPGLLGFGPSRSRLPGWTPDLVYFQRFISWLRTRRPLIGGVNVESLESLPYRGRRRLLFEDQATPFLNVRG